MLGLHPNSRSKLNVCVGYILLMSTPRCAKLLLSLVLLTGSSLQAGSLYEISWTAVRGVVTSNGTSLGAFTTSDTYWAFQNVTMPGDFTGEMIFPDLVMDPATAPASQTWTNGTGDSALLAFLFLPGDDGSGNVSVQPLVLDSTNLQPGDATFSVTNSGGTLKFNGSVSYTDLYTSGTGMLTISGSVTQGSPGAADATSTSFVIRDGSLLLTGKTAGAGAEMPEPSTGGVTTFATAVLLPWVITSQRRRRRIEL